jgi:hypothetical protein
MNEYFKTFIKITVILVIAYVTFKVTTLFTNQIANVIPTFFNLTNTL